jgi:hypothetical protein
VGGETIDAEVVVMKVRPGAVIRGVGVGVSYLASGKSTRTGSGILFASYAGAWFINKPGLQIYWIFPDMDEPWKRGSVSFATAVATWSAAMLATTTALRRTRLPAPIGALVLGGGFMAIDSFLADLGEKRDAAKAAETE